MANTQLSVKIALPNSRSHNGVCLITEQICTVHRLRDPYMFVLSIKMCAIKHTVAWLVV